MRGQRLFWILFALYLIFLGGGAYYNLIFEVRVAHHAIMTVGIGLWAFQRIRKNDFPQTRLNIALVVLGIAWAVGIITANDSRMAFERTWFMLIHVVAFIILVRFIQRGQQRFIFDTVFMMVVVALTLTTAELSMWLLGWGIYDVSALASGQILTITDIPLLTLAFGNSNLLAGFLAPILPLSLAWSMTASNSAHRWILRSVFVWTALLILATASRGAIANVGISLATFTLVMLWYKGKLPSFLNWRILVVGWGMVLIVAMSGLLFVGGRTDQGRQDMWRSALEITADNPILGVGIGNFGREFRDYRATGAIRDHLATAHNLFLNISAEGGIFFIFILAGVGGWWLYRAWDNVLRTPNSGHRIRLIATLSALLGIAFHSLVDVFTTTPTVLIFIVCLAYAITPLPRRRFDAPPTASRQYGFLLLALVGVYAIAWVQFDRAQTAYQDSWDQPLEIALQHINTAQTLDPHLSLYVLHEAWFIGEQAFTDDTLIQQAIEAYTDALNREPTWHIGWMNLAYFHDIQGDGEQAISAMQLAYDISLQDDVKIHLTRLQEKYFALSEVALINNYVSAISIINLPLADFWWQTSIRQDAVALFAEDNDIEIQYRIYEIHDQSRLESVIPTNPETAQEWYVVGAWAQRNDDLETAQEAYMQAFNLDPRGDYAYELADIATNETEAQSWLAQAEALGTLYTYPDIIDARWEEDVTEQIQYLINAIPQRITRQSMSAVLYDRPAIFDTVSPMWRIQYHEALLDSTWGEASRLARSVGNDRLADALEDLIATYLPYNNEIEQP